MKPTLGRKLANNLRDMLSECTREDAKQIVAFIRNDLTLDILARGYCSSPISITFTHKRLEMPQCYNLRVIPPPSRDSWDNEIGSGYSGRVFKIELDNELDVVRRPCPCDSVTRSG